jgi:hypothetical protein
MEVSARTLGGIFKTANDAESITVIKKSPTKSTVFFFKIDRVGGGGA